MCSPPQAASQLLNLNTDRVPLEYSYRESKERYGAYVVCGLEKKNVYKPCREVEFFFYSFLIISLISDLAIIKLLYTLFYSH